MIRSDAYFSDDRVYRYWLLRVWDDTLPMMANIGANPSTAAETVNDPTVRKDIGFATILGYGGLLKLNVGAYRATKPRDWYRAADPIGSDNTPEHIVGWLEVFGVKTTVGAWGRCIGKFVAHGVALVESIPDMMCFGCNLDGTPRHTLMLPYTTPMVRYREAVV